MMVGMEQENAAIQAIIDNSEEPTFDNVIAPRTDKLLSQATNVFFNQISCPARVPTRGFLLRYLIAGFLEWQVPTVFGVGASYTWARRLTIAFDYERQCMASALYNGAAGRESGLQDRNRFAFGLEYRHNPAGRKYVDNMRWRAGVSVQDATISGPL